MSKRLKCAICGESNDMMIVGKRHVVCPDCREAMHVLGQWLADRATRMMLDADVNSLVAAFGALWSGSSATGSSETIPGACDEREVPAKRMRIELMTKVAGGGEVFEYIAQSAAYVRAVYPRPDILTIAGVEMRRDAGGEWRLLPIGVGAGIRIVATYADDPGVKPICMADFYEDD